MRILISACLAGEACKYNGGHNRAEEILSLCQKHHWEYTAVCPEVLGGLPVPRKRSEIRDGRVVDEEGTDVTEAFGQGAEKALELGLKFGFDVAILQPRSPSCGCREIYDGTFTGRKIPGKGVFASMLKEKGYPVYDADEVTEEKLLDLEKNIGS